MKYISGTYALNTRTSLDTPGDWHSPAFNWNNLEFLDTEESLFSDWGIEQTQTPMGEPVCAANHIRACLDLLSDGKIELCQGMRNDYIANEKYTPIIFDKVSQLKSSPYWNKIDNFMGQEYLCDWLDYKEQHNE